MAGIGNYSTTIADIQSTPRTVNELKEFEKILRIRDEIFAGTHPRLKVSEQFIRKAPARQQQPSGSPSAINNSDTQLKRATTDDKPTLGHLLGLSHTAPAAVKSAPVARKPAPDLDPIFLAKSDDLVRAEIQLQRRRIEASLKEQAERSKHEAKEKTAHDVRPDFDVTAVLNKALDIVKPLPSPVEPIAHDVDYVDENSLYSSRSPGSPLTWDSEKQVRSDSDGQALSQVASIAGPASTKTDAQLRHSILQDSTDNPTLPQGPDNLKPPGQMQLSEEIAVDEPEYSPPEPTVPVVELSADDEYQPPEVLDGARHEEVSRLQPSARSRDGQVVRNHIISPVAPQPSRVSPLAIASAPSVQRLLSSKSKRQGYVNGDISDAYSRQTSPDGPVARQLLPRKRRRVYQPEIQNGRFEPRHNDTADARIKLEPVSPPPFHDTPPTRVYRAFEHPVYIDISSPQYVASADRREYVTREPFHDLDAPFENGSRRLGTPSEPSIRAASRLSTRKPARENQDLRRVVSLHNVRLPDAASQEHLGPVPRPHSAARASPFSLVERPSLDKATYYEEAVPTYSRRYQPYDDYPLPSGYREFYVDESGAPCYVEPVAPPRRIVVDEYGNEYYEMVPASSVRAAPLPTRVIRSDNYPERTYLRSSSVRAPSVMEEGYGARHYLPQEMAPPSVAYRRVADQVREVSDTPRIYPARTVVDRQGAFRSGSVAIEYPAGTPLRRAAYIEEEIPRNKYVRTTSVRPPSQRYESHPQQPQQHRDGLPRVQSVRPGTREVSVYLDENGQPVPREYDERARYDAAATAAATSVRSERPSKYVIREDGTRDARELVQGGTHRY